MTDFNISDQNRRPFMNSTWKKIKGAGEGFKLRNIKWEDTGLRVLANEMLNLHMITDLPKI